MIKNQGLALNQHLPAIPAQPRLPHIPVGQVGAGVPQDFHFGIFFWPSVQVLLVRIASGFGTIMAPVQALFFPIFRAFPADPVVAEAYPSHVEHPEPHPVLQEGGKPVRRDDDGVVSFQPVKQGGAFVKVEVRVQFG